MAKLETDSPLSRRIVRAFLDFLATVEPSPGVDLEGLEVARECLAEVFQLHSSPSADHSKPDDLIAIFAPLEASERGGTSDVANDAHFTEVSRPRVSGDNRMKEPVSLEGNSRDELFGQFFAALEKSHFFKAMPDGNEDPAQLDKATRLFHDALDEMKRSGSEAYDKKSLAEMLKCQGNRVMQSKLYSDAIELYNVAIALSEDNAIYYCNRAAAYTQIHKYDEAIRDCLKSIEIDPNYSKAYSRLGLVYYAQGNYADSIEKGFKKALQLDPNNESVKENIRVAERKLKEEQQCSEQHRDTDSGHGNQESSQSTGGSRSRGGLPPFTMPFDFSSLPGDLGSMFTNMASGAHPGQPPQNQPGGDGQANGSDDPGIRIGGNISFNIGEQMPEELSGAVRSVMQMFTGGSPQGHSQGTTEQMPEELSGALRSVMEMFTGGSPQGHSQGTTGDRPAAN